MKTRDWRDMAQNLLIVLLSVSAVALFTQTQLYSLGVDRGAALGAVVQPADGTGSPAQTAALTAPVRVAVTGAYGRYGSIALTTGEDAFAEPLGRRLAEALGSAGSYRASSQGAFLAALKGPSLYYDFLQPLPLCVLAELTGGGETAEEEIAARYLVLAAQGGGSLLFLWDGAEGWLQAETAVSADSLRQAAEGYEQGGASLALDGGEDSLEAKLAPCSLLPEELPELPVLAVEDPLSDTDALLQGLGFNPRTRTRYLESNGTELITDGDRSLRIRPDRTVHYLSGSDPALTIEAQGERPTLLEAVRGAGALLNRVLTPVSGEGVPWLQSAERNGENVSLRFGYQVRGVPVRLSGGDFAAEVTLRGKTVSVLTLRFRRYTATEEMSLLLPLPQVLAVAAGQGSGKELAIGYVDSGGRCAAHWLAD